MTRSAMKAIWVLMAVGAAACGGKTSGDGSDTVPVDAPNSDGLQQICETGTRWCEENDAMECTANGLSAWRTPCGTGTCFQGTCCTRMCFDKNCGDDGCGGVCGDCGPFLSCDEETWECGSPCADELFSNEVCGSGEDVQASCGACTPDGAGTLCIREEEDAEGVLQTWCECYGGEEGFRCTWMKSIPDQVHCQEDDDCPGGFCTSACHPHVLPYCTANCMAHADCPEGTYCGDFVSVNFWEEPDDWPPHGAARCVPDGYQVCGYCDPEHPHDGCPCETDADCGTDSWDLCLPARHGRMCSVTRCMPECEQELACGMVSGVGPDMVFSCVDPNIIEGMPCHSNGDCVIPWDPLGSERYCVVQGEVGAFCTVGAKGAVHEKPCLGRGPCYAMPCCPIPEDFLECPWYHVAMEASTDCTVSNEFGACLGERRCTEAGLTDCDAVIPAEETCDGVDNDCDGETDEGC